MSHSKDSSRLAKLAAKARLGTESTDSVSTPRSDEPVLEGQPPDAAPPDPNDKASGPISTPGDEKLEGGNPSSEAVPVDTVEPQEGSPAGEGDAGSGASGEAPSVPNTQNEPDPTKVHDEPVVEPQKPVPPSADSASEEDLATVGLKPAGTDKAEPLVGQSDHNVGDVPRDAPNIAESMADEGPHGRPEEARQAAVGAVEVSKGRVKDAPSSSEAADQIPSDGIDKDDRASAFLAAAHNAKELHEFEKDFGPNASSVGVMLASNKKDPAEARRRAGKSVKDSEDRSPNSVRARADASVQDLEDADSPHGRQAERVDPWAATRWAPHGDMNVVADSAALNDLGKRQARSLDIETENKNALKG